MKLSDFNYEFPEELIAQRPLSERTASRMMIVDRESGKWKHSRITDLPSFLKQGDVLIVNDSRVVPARIFGNLRGGKPVELLLVQKIGGNEKSAEKWRCIIKRARNFHKGDKFFFGISATADVAGRDGDFLVVEFPAGHRQRAVERCGVPPLPPYIKRQGYESYSEEDRERYQTIYANESGSVAAPTAGLHFSGELLDRIKDSGVTITTVTLHVGADTFAPVRVDDINDHKMHGEVFWVSEETAEMVNRVKKEGWRVIAVGTTTVRALESCAKDGICYSGKRETDLFITPGYKFQVVDALLTNFHQPKSTLLMLVSAFAGRDLILSAYADAIKNSYRLFSYGDCMLIT
jgi:S-adenosylmethionine:tRNA ribosyltransferase-isomerase